MPSTRASRASMALSLALHGIAAVLLLAAGAAGSSTANETALLVELAFAPAPSAAEAERESTDSAQEREAPSEKAPQMQAHDATSETMPHTQEPEMAIDLAPPEEPPPIDVSELKPVEPPKPPPPKPEPLKPAAKPTVAKPAAPKPAPSHDFGSPSSAQQAAAGFMAAAPIVWEGKPRYRHPPTPAAYPARAIELGQQGEVLVRVRLDSNGTAVEIVIHRSSGSDLLDRAALTAVRSWQFLPAVRDGRPVASWVEIPVRFHLR